jgi:hypothetical protein
VVDGSAAATELNNRSPEFGILAPHPYEVLNFAIKNEDSPVEFFQFESRVSVFGEIEE